jgi:hypothetical protein
MKKNKKFQDMVQEAFENGINNNVVKLNFRCPKDMFVPDSFACGKTPAEAKKNYANYQKKKKVTKRAVDATKTAKKIIKKLPKGSTEDISTIKNIISKIQKEKKESGFVSKDLYREAKKAIKDIRDKNKASRDSKSAKIDKVVVESKKSVTDKKPTSSGKSNFKYPKNYSGLQNIKDQIDKAGGESNFFNSADIPDLPQIRRVEMDAIDLRGQRYMRYDSGKEIEDMDFKMDPKVIKSIGDIEFHKIGIENESIGLFTKKGDMVGYVLNYEGGVDAVIADEIRGLGGIGRRALIEFFNLNPDKITDVGGLTPNGKKAYTKMIRAISLGYKDEPVSDEEKKAISEACDRVSENIKAGPLVKHNEIPASMNDSFHFIRGSRDFEVHAGELWNLNGKDLFIKGITSKYIFLRSEDNNIIGIDKMAENIRGDFFNKKSKLVKDFNTANIKENARGAITRQLPIEEAVREDGQEILESTIDDVMKALREEGFFDLEAE